MKSAVIPGELFEFLQEVADNNRREWFSEHKERYELQVRRPLQDFITAFEKPLHGISRYFRADPRPVGGSLFRIHRDVRFSPDKSPYKTHAGIQFRHEQGRDVHAPGFYLHLEPGNVFAAAGIWRPDARALRKIREAIVADPDAWVRAVSASGFTASYRMSGDSLKQLPRDFDPAHPLIEDLKRKEFIASSSLSEQEACSPDFLEHYARLAQAASPFMRFLTLSLELPW